MWHTPSSLIGIIARLSERGIFNSDNLLFLQKRFLSIVGPALVAESTASISASPNCRTAPVSNRSAPAPPAAATTAPTLTALACRAPTATSPVVADLGEAVTRPPSISNGHCDLRSGTVPRKASPKETRDRYVQKQMTAALTYLQRLLEVVSEQGSFRWGEHAWLFSTCSVRIPVPFNTQVRDTARRCFELWQQV